MTPLTADLGAARRVAALQTVRAAVQDAQQRLGQPQEVAEAVEAEVDQLPRQLNHLWNGIYVVKPSTRIES